MLRKSKEFHLFNWFDVVAVGALAIFLIIIANIAWVLPILDEVEKSAYNLLYTQAINTVNQISTFVEEDKKTIENGALLINRGLREPEDVVLRLLRENRSFDAMLLLDAEGKAVFVRQNRFVVESGILNEDLFPTVQKEGTYLSDLVLNKINQPTLEVAIGLQEETGFTVFVGQINLKFFLDAIFEDVRFTKENTTYIVDNSGYLIGHTDWQLVAAKTHVSDRKLVELALKGQEVNTRTEELLYTNENGLEVFATAIPIELTGWVVVVETPDDPALAATRRTLIVAGFAVGFQIFLILLLIWAYFYLTKAARSLYQERNEREILVDNLLDGVVEYDSDMRILVMNPKAEELLKITFEEISDIAILPNVYKTNPRLRSLVEIMYPITAPSATAPENIPGTKAQKMRIVTSSRLTLEVTVTRVLDREGNVVGFLKILHDITKEALLEKMKSEFVSIAAHQLRTPLSAVKWAITVFLEETTEKLTKAEKHLIDIAYESNERMITLVNGLLNVARIEEGRFRHKPTYADLQDIIEAVILEIKNEYQPQKVKIIFRKAQGKLPKVLVDKDAIKLAIRNILENAIEYTLPGGTVTVSTTLLDKQLQISIQDTGIGIPEEEKPRIYSKFYRGQHAILLSPNRSGLGLFIVKNIIEAHEGKIWFESKIGKGTTFHISLPFPPKPQQFKRMQRLK